MGHSAAPLSSGGLIIRSGYFTALQNLGFGVFCFILWLSAVVIGLMCLSSRRIQSVLTRSICSSHKTVLPFLFSVQNKT